MQSLSLNMVINKPIKSYDSRREIYKDTTMISKSSRRNQSICDLFDNYIFKKKRAKHHQLKFVLWWHGVAIIISRKEAIIVIGQQNVFLLCICVCVYHIIYKW